MADTAPLVQVPSHLLDYRGGLSLDQNMRKALAPPPDWLVWQWADERRKLNRKHAKRAGKWRTDVVPFMREPMAFLSARSQVQRIDLMKGAQVSGTETANNWVGYAPPDMLRGAPNDDGVVVAKVSSYEIVSDQDDEYIEITMKACVGSGLVWTGGNGLVSQTGEGWDRVLYGSYGAQVPESLPDLEAAVAVTNDVPKQISTVQGMDFAPGADPPRKDIQVNDPKNVIKTVPTSLAIYLTQISGRPDMSHDIIIPVVAPLSGPRQWSIAA